MVEATLNPAHPKLGSRALVPTLAPRAYLNHAAISPPSLPVTAAAREVLDAYAAEGVGAFMRFAEARQRLREKLARLVGAPSAAGIAFVPNTTRGITDVALCIPWHEGDRVALTRGEFPANVTPWQRAADLFGLELVWLPQPRAHDGCAEWLAELEAALARGLRLVAVSSVEFQTGLRLPLEEVGRLCAERGAELAVDAIQGLGAVPLDVERARIDYLSCGSHKWLMGLEGVGFLHVRPEKAALLRPHVAGWLSHDHALAFLFEGTGRLRYDRTIMPTARMVEGGMGNTIGCAALEAAVDCILSLGVEAIWAHVDRYHAALVPRLEALGLTSLRARDPALRSGSACFLAPPEVDVVALHKAIDPAAVSCAIPDGHLRLSPHWPNALAEIDGVVAAIERAIVTARD
jgi:cysteine desulfurase/selenocysteine lyase